jgi:BirA family biotin operon repressor/biotin-[acetyl-CoA-carboxylase] ligase
MTDRQAAALIRQLADGRFQSGEALAQLLGVSRTAVWKRIRQVADDTGLTIHAVRGKGYRLAEPLELLDADRISRGIREASAHDPGVEVHSSLASTNTHLGERLDQLDGSTLCFAEHQTAGRGRHGREWVSPYGANLYFSLYHRFPLAMQELGGLSLAIGAAVAEVLSESIPDIRLKWPNDLLLDGRKLAGILVDVHGSADGPVDTVIGVGLNVAMPLEQGGTIDQPWTDLRGRMEDVPSRNSLAIALSVAVLEATQQFRGVLPETYLRSWRRFDAWQGEPVRLQRGPEAVLGVHAGIADDGSLRMLVDGQERLFQSGEVSLRKEERA